MKTRNSDRTYFGLRKKSLTDHSTKQPIPCQLLKRLIIHLLRCKNDTKNFLSSDVNWKTLQDNKNCITAFRLERCLHYKRNSIELVLSQFNIFFSCKSNPFLSFIMTFVSWSMWEIFIGFVRLFVRENMCSMCRLPSRDNHEMALHSLQNIKGREH